MFIGRKKQYWKKRPGSSAFIAYTCKVTTYFSFLNTQRLIYRSPEEEFTTLLPSFWGVSTVKSAVKNKPYFSSKGKGRGGSLERHFGPWNDIFILVFWFPHRKPTSFFLNVKYKRDKEKTFGSPWWAMKKEKMKIE